jgi:lambda repressor-like predicted transcriptional regulator
MTEDTLRTRILAEIETRGLSVAAAARLAGVKYDVIRDLKRGKALTTSSENAVRIANALGVVIPDVQPPEFSKEEAELAQIYRSLSPEDREQAIWFLKKLRAAGNEGPSDNDADLQKKAVGIR